MTYLIQIFIYSTVLFLGYKLLFSRTSFFKLRRFILLSIPILSLIIPFSDKLLPKTQSIFTNVYYLNPIDISEIQILNNNVSNTSSINYINYISYLYLLIALVLAIVFILKIIHIYKIKQNAINENGIYYTKENYSPFSFFNLIFISNTNKEKADTELIISHEKAHIKQLHSIDILYFEILIIAFWYNPVFYLVKKEIAIIHEYLADKSVLNKGIDVKRYSEIIMNNIYLNLIPIANNLNNSLIKNRFIMMTQSSKKKNLPIRLTGILVLFIMVLSFNNCVKQNKNNDIEYSDNLQNRQVADSTYEFINIDVKPKFTGGNYALMTYIAENTSYPKIAKEAEVEATIFIQFVINKKGKVEKVEMLNPNDKVGNSKEFIALKDEAIRVVSSMPDWEAGEVSGEKVDVSYILPIRFQLR